MIGRSIRHTCVAYLALVGMFGPLSRVLFKLVKVRSERFAIEALTYTCPVPWITDCLCACLSIDETTEPVNALDGLIQKTGYGPDVEVGKGFMMSWASRWADWLAFDNYRGPNGGSLLNREVTTAFLGVCILGTQPSWTANPLNMVNYFAYGSLAWDTTLTAEQIHEEWIHRTFGAVVKSTPSVRETLHSILSTSETAADLLALYRGYRGVWYKFETDDSLRPKPVNNQKLGADGAGMPTPLAHNLLSQYSPGVRSIYTNLSDPRAEAMLLEFGVFKLSYMLTNGRTLIEDMRLRPSEGVNATLRMQAAWNKLRAPLATMGNLWTSVSRELELFVTQAQLQEQRLHSALAKLHQSLREN